MNTLLTYGQQLTMKENQFATSFLACEWLGWLSCKSTNTDAAFSITPKINLLDISPNTTVQLQKFIVHFISYEDGNGNLGTSDPHVNSNFVKDQRLEETEKYFLGRKLQKFYNNKTVGIGAFRYFSFRQRIAENQRIYRVFESCGGHASNLIETS